jgi:hypothetical protein
MDLSREKEQTVSLCSRRRRNVETELEWKTVKTPTDMSMLLLRVAGSKMMSDGYTCTDHKQNIAGLTAGVRPFVAF